jgi:DNA-binding response OmpR family regulator
VPHPTSPPADREGLLIGCLPEELEPIARALASSGYRCAAVDRGQALQALDSTQPSFVVLDHDPPNPEAWQLLRKLVEFIRAPVGPAELAARVEAMLRRHAKAAAPAEVISGPLVEIDIPRRTAHAFGREILLTPTEFRLLAALARYPDEVLSHSRLVEMVWPGALRELGEVKLYISYLRRTFRRAVGIDPIETVRGVGYRYEPRIEDTT